MLGCEECFRRGAFYPEAPFASEFVQVLGLTLGVCLGSWALCYMAFDWILQNFTLMPGREESFTVCLPVNESKGFTLLFRFPGMDARMAMAASSLGATLMMARSPASAVSLKANFKGPSFSHCHASSDTLCLPSLSRNVPSTNRCWFASSFRLP